MDLQEALESLRNGEVAKAGSPLGLFYYSNSKSCKQV